MFCPECGNQLNDGALFCPVCGSEISGPRREHPAPPMPRPRRSKWRGALIAVAAVVVLVGIGVGGFLLLKTFTPGVFGFTFVNEAAFPDERVRMAASDQLDANRDGILTPEDVASVASTSSKGTRQGLAGTTEESYAFDGAGRLTSMNATTDANSIITTRETVGTYDDVGRCTSFALTTHDHDKDDDVKVGGNLRSITTEYNPAGNPLQTVCDGGYPVIATDYLCNSDGYVTQASWITSDVDFRDGLAMEMSYVKMAGSLGDRAKLRYVPRFSFRSVPLFDPGSDLSHGWFQSNGDSTIVTVVEETVEQSPYREAGLVSNALSVLNEVQLEAYDRLARSSEAASA